MARTESFDRDVSWRAFESGRWVVSCLYEHCDYSITILKLRKVRTWCPIARCRRTISSAVIRLKSRIASEGVIRGANGIGVRAGALDEWWGVGFNWNVASG